MCRHIWRPAWGWLYLPAIHRNLKDKTCTAGVLRAHRVGFLNKPWANGLSLEPPKLLHPRGFWGACC